MDPERIPRVLVCGHTFCTSCLEQCVRMRAIPCPLCARSTPLAFGLVTRIPPNQVCGEVFYVCCVSVMTSKCMYFLNASFKCTCSACATLAFPLGL